MNYKDMKEVDNMNKNIIETRIYEHLMAVRAI